MHDEFNPVSSSDAKGVSTRKQFDQVTSHRCNCYLPRWVDGNSIARHLLREDFVGNAFQVDNRAIERSENVYLCHYLLPYLLTLLCDLIARAAVFHEAIDAAGNTVRLCSHHDLGDLAPLDHTRGTQALEACLVDLFGVVDEEPKPCDAALHALYICLAAECREYLSSQYVIAILRRRTCCSSCSFRNPGAALAFGQNPVGTQAGRGFTAD